MNLPDNIIISEDLPMDLGAFFQASAFSNIAVLVDEHTHEFCYPLVRDILPAHHVIKIKSGEEEKNLHTCMQIWDALTEMAFDRKALMINIGGGVIGDMGGFCASTYKRGIRFVNIPTTLLAQVDASIGGKLGVDFKNYKNHIGIFQNPLRVFLSADFFDTLPSAEKKSGFAEIIKHCLIRDAQMFEKILQIPYDLLDLKTLTQHSVLIKNQVVAEDPKEMGLRKILNFGHTIGHAIESYFLEKPGKKLLHGEAVAVGMICEAYLSHKKLSLDAGELEKLVRYIIQVYEPVRIAENDLDGVLQMTAQDKKNEGGKIKASLLNMIGDCNFNIEITHEEISASIRYFNETISLYTK